MFEVQPSVPRAVAVLFDQHLHLSDKLSRKFWRALVADEGPAALAFCFGAARIPMAQDRLGALTNFLSAVPPSRLIPIVEGMASRGVLSRKEANQVEEAILSQTTVSGLWK
jgi:hypothetical protein